MNCLFSGMCSLENKDAEKLAPVRVTDTFTQPMMAEHVGNQQDFIEDDVISVHQPPCGFMVHIQPLAGDIRMRSVQLLKGFLPQRTAGKAVSTRWITS